VHRKYIPIYIQQDATLHSLFISGDCSTCFEWYLHPSSGAAYNCVYSIYIEICLIRVRNFSDINAYYRNQSFVCSEVVYNSYINCVLENKCKQPAKPLKRERKIWRIESIKFCYKEQYSSYYYKREEKTDTLFKTQLMHYVLKYTLKHNHFLKH